MMYVRELPLPTQKKIKRVIRAKLELEGLADKEIKKALQDAMDSKVSDLSDALK